MNAVNHLGIKNAVPKTILQLMNVEGMTRENVASHLQKYRLVPEATRGRPAVGAVARGYHAEGAPVPVPRHRHRRGVRGDHAVVLAHHRADARGGPARDADARDADAVLQNLGARVNHAFKDAEAFHAQMAATAQFMSYMGAAGAAAGGFGPPPGAHGWKRRRKRRVGGGSDEHEHERGGDERGGE